MRASKAGETEKVLGLMADDVVCMVPGQKPFGKPDLKLQQTPTQAEPLYRYRLSVEYAQKL